MTGTNTFSPTDLQYIINEVWAPQVEREFQANLVAAVFFTDLSDLLAGGGDTINITDIFTNQFTAQNKSNASEVTLQSPAQAQIQLTVNTWKEVSFLIEDKEMQQVLQSAKIAQEYADQAKYVIAKALDTSLMALYSGLSQSVNDTASDVSDGVVRDAIKRVVAADVPLEQLAFFFHPTVVWHDLMGISKYYTASTLGGDTESPVVSGKLGGALRSKYRGILYGIPVYETTQVQADGANTAYYNLLAHPKTFAYAIQTPGGRIRSQSNYIPENLGTLWTTDIIYGVAELRDETGVVIKSRQTGIVS